jgi:transposase InsO family protein
LRGTIGSGVCLGPFAYIPKAGGFVYPAIVLDWFSRRMLSWRLSITMEVSFCIAALEDKSVGDARSSIGRGLDSYNTKRPHQSLDGATPVQAYFTALPLRAAA